MTDLLEAAISTLNRRQPSFCIGPRPGKKSLAALTELNLTHCCTLLSQREQARNIEKICRELQCQWIWLPIEGGRLDILRQTDVAAHIVRLAHEVASSDNPRVYFHCSAGIHRTGFFVYCLLRLQGNDGEQARTELARLRPVTAEQVGNDRLELADQLVAELE